MSGHSHLLAGRTGLLREVTQGARGRRNVNPALPTVLSLLESLADDDVPYILAERGLTHLVKLTGFQTGVYATLGHEAPASGTPGGPPEAPTLTLLIQRGQPLEDAAWAALTRAARTLEPQHLRSMPSRTTRFGPPERLEIVLQPVSTAGRTTGLLALIDTRPAVTVTPDSSALLAVLAQQLGKASDRQLAENTLNRTREQTFRVLGRMLEYRSHETKGHTDRVTNLALQLGLKLDLTYDELTHLRWGAYLHDVGKIAIADDVLHKDGPLDGQERDLMAQHVTIGEAILREQGLVPAEVLDIVRHHHERWDGRGYPDALRGEQIPLLARVFAVVDVYDALSSERAYKPSWTDVAAMEELQRMAGDHLDPRLVQLFQEVLLQQHQFTQLSHDHHEPPGEQPAE